MLRRWIPAITSLGALRLVGFACAVGWGLAFLVFVARFPGPVDSRGRPTGGDFLNFYTAGRMILEGHGERLYDVEVQQAVQKAVVGRADYRGLAAYVNPPTLALACAPLAALPYRLAYILYTVGALAAFLAAMRMLRPHVPALQRQWMVTVLLALTFYPMVRTITGGQNTPLSFLLLVMLYTGLRTGRPGWAGTALGLLCFKPQFAVVLGLLLLARRQYRCVAVAAGIGLVHYVAGALACGGAWPLEMLKTLARYGLLEFQYNGATQVSWLGFFEYAMGRGPGTAVGGLVAAATLLAVAWRWRRAGEDRDSFDAWWAASVAATVLVSPHTQYYDTGLILAAILPALDLALRGGGAVGPGMRGGLALAYGLFPAYPLARLLGWQPLILVPVLALVWVWRQAAGEGDETSAEFDPARTTLRPHTAFPAGGR